MSTRAAPLQDAAGHPPHRPGLAGASRAPVLASVVAAVLATTVVLWGVRGAGHRLVRDFVAVPDPAAPVGLLPTTAAALRAWPLDAVTWAVSTVVPTAVQQVVLITVCLAGAGVGAGLVVARAGTAAAAAAAWLAVWNPYVTERLLLGHVPTLLGYACLPWVVVVGRSRLATGRRIGLLALVAAPAVLTPWGGVVMLVAAVLVELSRPDRRPVRVALVAGLGVLWCLPWLVPAVVLGGVAADPDGPAAFALADDSGLGTWLSALMGGGVWATGAQPLSRTDPVSLIASLALVVVAAGAAVAAVAGAVRARTTAVAQQGHRVTGSSAAVAVLLLLGPATLAWWASGPGLDLVGTLQQVPGMALFRDQHRMLGAGVLAQVVLVSLVVGWLAGRAGRTGAALGAALVVALAVASVPDLPGAVRTAYRPVTYPAGWTAVVDVVGQGSGTPTVLSLPWQPLRRPGWAGDPPFLDPLPRAVHGDVLVSTALSVRRGDELVVVDDSPTGEVWASGVVSAESLRRHGVTHVVEWLGTPGALAAQHDRWRLLHSGPDFRVWDVTGA